MAEHFVARNTG